MIALVLVTAAGLAGCGGTLGKVLATPAPQVVVMVTGPGDVRLGSQVQLVATVSNSANTGVTWQVNGVTGGSVATGEISATGLYTAPAAMPDSTTVSITAVSQAAATASASLPEALLNPVPVLSSTVVTQTTPGTLYGVEVQGTGFVGGALVQVNGVPASSTFVSSNELQASITLPVGTTLVHLLVTNPNPGGSDSATLQAQVQTIAVSLAASARLLDQTTFGPTLQDIQHVEQVGLEAYLDEQLNAPITPMPDIPANPTAICIASVPTACEQSEWWQAALTADDQLRQRVAFALSEIFVVSTDSVNARSVVTYQNLLLKDAFGNFSTLMKDVTLSTAMGGYLNMLNSGKPGTGQIANENFARELMQLFTMGLNQLNQDGTQQLDAFGNPMPTYPEAAVQSFARAYTGWTYATAAGKVPPNYPWATANYALPMIASDRAHDMGQKTLLGGTVLPAGGTAEQDLDGALGNVFNQTSVAPFISMQLIQHLVMSNPSPAYVERVAAVFGNNGMGVRGDLKAVVRAILTDPEARAGDTAVQAEGGHLREGILYVANLYRGLGFNNKNADGDYSNLSYYSGTLGEAPFAASSVFSFFSPQYVIPGSTIAAPEFSLENTSTAVLRLSLADEVVHNQISGFNVDFSATSRLVQIASTPADLVDTLGLMFLHGQMPVAMRTAIINHIAALSSPSQRARVATYLVITSPQYKILH